MDAAVVVFCDTVRFSRLGSPEQVSLISKLNAEVTHELYGLLNTRDVHPKVICLPTGDGLAVALLDPHTAWTTMFGLVNRLMTWKEREGVQLRIGIHLGPVSIISDINRNTNVCGDTINTCQRIMDAANPGQVLVSDEARREWLGSNSQYTGVPFSPECPAYFSDPHTILAKHGLRLNVCVMHRGPTRDDWDDTPPHARWTHIVGKSERTQFITEKLARLRETPGLRIYEQSAFSTFGIPEDPAYWQRAGYSCDYASLLLKQKTQLLHLVSRPDNRSRFIFYPVRYAAPELLALRCCALLKWIEDARGLENVDYVTAHYKGPNRLIVVDPRGRHTLCVEGFKLHDTAGYEMTIVVDDPRQVDMAIAQFDETFTTASQLGAGKVAAEQQLRELADELRPTADPEGSGGAG